MFILNTENLPKKKLYYCYSPPLNKWLKKEKNIFPIWNGVYKKPGEFEGNKFEVYINCDELDLCLQEWTNNKKNKTFAVKIKHKVVL